MSKTDAFLRVSDRKGDGVSVQTRRVLRMRADQKFTKRVDGVLSWAAEILPGAAFQCSYGVRYNGTAVAVRSLETRQPALRGLCSPPYETTSTTTDIKILRYIFCYVINTSFF